MSFRYRKQIDKKIEKYFNENSSAYRMWTSNIHYDKLIDLYKFVSTVKEIICDLSDNEIKKIRSAKNVL